MLGSFLKTKYITSMKNLIKSKIKIWLIKAKFYLFFLMNWELIVFGILLIYPYYVEAINFRTPLYILKKTLRPN